MRVRTDFRPKRLTLLLALHTIGVEAVGIIRVVVVHSPRRVDIADIVAIADIRGTQPPTGRSYSPYPKYEPLLFQVET